YGIEVEGNWEGQNVLAVSLQTSSEVLNMTQNKKMRDKILEYRNRRVAPIRDDKAIVAWNAWMISALFKASINLSGADAELSNQLKQTARVVLDNFLSRVEISETKLQIPRIFYGDDAAGEFYLEDGVAFVEALQFGAIATG